MWGKLHWYCITVLYSLLLLSRAVCESRSFPATSDPTLADQQRWGAYSRGYVTDGCWHGPAATLNVNIASCRAFVLDQTDPAKLVGVEELQASTLNYPPGDGTTWLGLRATPSAVMPGWTCQSGLPYCLLTSATPPVVPSGLLLLGKTTVAAGAITKFVIMAPWRPPTPVVVPAGTTLIFGVCPDAGRWPLWDANGTTTGAVHFAPGACGEVYPEWWGVDNTGLVDSAPLWNAIIPSTTLQTTGYGNTAIACEGVYRLLSTVTLRSRTSILGPYKTSATAAIGAKSVPCQFNYEGTGDAFEAPDIGMTYHDLQLRNLRVVDVLQTANRAFDLVGTTGLTMVDVTTQYFNQPFFFTGDLYYSRVEQITARLYRNRCLEITGGANFASVDVICSGTTGATVVHGVRIGGEPGLYGQSHGVRLKALVEADSGAAVILQRIEGGDIELYIETPGVCTNYSAIGVVQVNQVAGGRIQAFVEGNCSGGGLIPLGVYVIDSSGVENARNTVWLGHVKGSFTTRLRVDSGEGLWGHDMTAFQTGTERSTLGLYSTGVRLGNNYLTHGNNPASFPNTGRASTVLAETWRIGDTVFSTVDSVAEIGNYLFQATVGGNPGTWVALVWPTLTSIALADGDATPTLKSGNTYHTRALAVASSTAITDFDDEADGQCLIIRASGTRTITHGAPIVLEGAANFAMTSGDMLHLCVDSGVWREVVRGNN